MNSLDNILVTTGISYCNKELVVPKIAQFHRHSCFAGASVIYERLWPYYILAQWSQCYRWNGGGGSPLSEARYFISSHKWLDNYGRFTLKWIEALSVMAIVIGNELSFPSSNPEQRRSHFTLRKGMNLAPYS